MPDETAQTAPTRRQPLSVSPRARVLAAAGVAVTTLTVASFALFSDSGTVAATFTAGTLDLEFDAAEDGDPDPYVVAFDGASDLAPGRTATSDLVVYNSGSVPAVLAMGVPDVTNAATGTALLEHHLTLRITDASAAELYSGPLASATFAGLDLGSGGTTATGEVLTFAVTFDGDADVDVAGQSVRVDLPFTATQHAP